MKNQVIFIPHKIEGEEGLPKKRGNYIFLRSESIITNEAMHFRPISDDNFAIIYKYWLEEVPVPTDEDIKTMCSTKIIEKYVPEDKWEVRVNWVAIDAMNQLLLKLHLK